MSNLRTSLRRSSVRPRTMESGLGAEAISAQALQRGFGEDVIIIALFIVLMLSAVLTHKDNAPAATAVAEPAGSSFDSTKLNGRATLLER